MGCERKRTVFRLLLFAAILLPVIGLSLQTKADAMLTTTIRVDSANVTAGSIAEIHVTIQNNPGILGAKLEVTYPSGLELLNAENGAAFSALALTPPGAYQSPCAFLWDGTNLRAEDITDGTILTLRFRVASGLSEETDLPVSLSYTDGDIVDNSLTPVPVSVVGGILTVKRVSAAVQGISFATGKVNGTTASLRVYCTEAYPKATVVLAAYSATGQMEWCDLNEISLSSGDNGVGFSIQRAATSYKAFFLSPSMQPCCKAITVLSGASYTVRFTDHDGLLLSEQYIAPGGNAVPPSDPVRDGYAFAGWNGSYMNVTSDRTIVAQYAADTTPTLVVSTASARSGASDVAVTLSIRNNPGILGMTLTLNYDGNNLTLNSVESGPAVQGVLNLTSPGELKPQCNFVWDGVSVSQNQIRDGVLLTLHFNVAATASGECPITITYEEDDIVDSTLSTVSLTIQNGAISVE